MVSPTGRCLLAPLHRRDDVVGLAEVFLAAMAAVRSPEDAVTIVLYRGITPEEFEERRCAAFVHWICAVTGHHTATRYGWHSTRCLCGAWERRITLPADDDPEIILVLRPKKRVTT